MKSTRWVIIDTETDGLQDPIHVLELSGQLMEGWEPVGEPFRCLLNHDIPIPYEATAIHGYTRNYLRKHGQNPASVYEAFRDYAKNLPLVAHNLGYDWDRCLMPEWTRLGIRPIGQRGFCCLLLARRLAHESNGHRLDALKECFALTESRSHQALNDVLTVVELFQRVYRPRLEAIGYDTFEQVAAFSQAKPITHCRDLIRAAKLIQPLSI